MKEKKMMIITSLVCLLPILLGVVLYPQLPEQIATHFDSHGVANGYSPKAFAVFGLPVFLAVINAICHVAIANDPKRSNSAPVIANISKWICPVCSIIINPVMYLIALGYDNMPVTMITTMLVSMLIIILGAYMPKCKQNYTIGIKLPWTLHDEENWNKTHKFAGMVWVIGGSVMLVAGLFEVMWVFGVVLAVIVVVPAVYSFVYYKKSK